MKHCHTHACGDTRSPNESHCLDTRRIETIGFSFTIIHEHHLHMFNCASGESRYLFVFKGIVRSTCSCKHRAEYQHPQIPSQNTQIKLPFELVVHSGRERRALQHFAHLFTTETEVIYRPHVRELYDFDLHKCTTKHCIIGRMSLI